MPKLTTNFGESMIKVLVVDDHDLVRMGITRMLADSPDIQVIADADNGETAILLAKNQQPDVVLLDVNMPNMDGLEVTKRLMQIDKNSKILAVSSLASQPYPAMLIKAGVTGYITKGTPLDEMIKVSKKSHKAGVILVQMWQSNLPICSPLKKVKIRLIC